MTENENVEIEAEKDFDLSQYVNQNYIIGDRYLTGKSLMLNRTWRVKVLEYIGLQEKEFSDGPKTIPYLKVEVEQAENKPNVDYQIEAGQQYLFGINQTNAKYLISQGIKSFGELKDKVLEGLVVSTQKGNGLTITDIK